MIRVIVKKESDDIIGFHMKGHAGYARHGRDIVCAAVSALAVNCVNAIEEYTEDEFTLETDKASGQMDFMLKGPPSAEAELLLKALVLGVGKISKSYGKRYVTLNVRRKRSC